MGGGRSGAVRRGQAGAGATAESGKAISYRSTIVERRAMKTSTRHVNCSVSSFGSRLGENFAKMPSVRKQMRRPNVSCSDDPGSKKTGRPGRRPWH